MKRLTLLALILSVGVAVACDNNFSSGGKGGAIYICADFDEDGVGRVYRAEAAGAGGYPYPDVNCLTAIDCDDDEPGARLVCTPPAITSPAPAQAFAGGLNEYQVDCAQEEEGVAVIVVTVGPNDTCNGLVNFVEGTWVYYFTPAVPGTCVFEVVCTDVQDGQWLSDEQTTTIIVLGGGPT